MCRCRARCYVRAVAQKVVIRELGLPLAERDVRAIADQLDPEVTGSVPIEGVLTLFGVAKGAAWAGGGGMVLLDT